MLEASFSICILAGAVVLLVFAFNMLTGRFN